MRKQVKIFSALNLIIRKLKMKINRSEIEIKCGSIQSWEEKRFCLDLFIVRIRFLFVFLAELMNFYWPSTAHKAGALQIGFNSLAHASFFGKKFSHDKSSEGKAP